MCISLPGQMIGKKALSGTTGDCGNPAPTSPIGPLSTAPTISRPTKFSISVAITSLTPRQMRRRAAMPLHRAPPRAPAASEMTIGRGPGAAPQCKAAHVVQMPPMAICPSPPMLIIRARKHSATPTPARMYGALLFRANEIASTEPNAPRAMTRYASMGFLPDSMIKNAATPNASSTASTEYCSLRPAPAARTQRSAQGSVSCACIGFSSPVIAWHPVDR